MTALSLLCFFFFSFFFYSRRCCKRVSSPFMTISQPTKKKSNFTQVGIDVKRSFNCMPFQISPSHSAFPIISQRCLQTRGAALAREAVAIAGAPPKLALFCPLPSHAPNVEPTKRSLISLGNGLTTHSLSSFRCSTALQLIVNPTDDQ